MKNKVIDIILSCTLLAVLCFSVSVHARDYVQEVSVLESCQDTVIKRLESISLENEKIGRINTLKSCLSVLTDLYNPNIVNHEGVKVEGFDLFFHADFAVGYFNFVAGKQDYINIIKGKLSETEIDNFAKAYEGGVERVVSDSYDELEGWFFVDNLRGLKKVIVDFTQAFFISEMKALRVENSDRFNIEEKAHEFAQDLDQCFKKSFITNQIELCVGLLNEYAAASIGEPVLLQNLKIHFLPQVDSSHHDQVIKKVLEEYEQCSVLYFFNTQVSTKSVEKIKACVYSSMIVGFHEIAQLAVEEQLQGVSELSSEKLSKIIDQSLLSCERSDLLTVTNKTMAYYDKLASETPESIEKLARNCQTHMESSIVSAIALITIQEHEAIKSLIGVDKSKNLAQSVIEKHFKVCVSKVKSYSAKATARDCSNYLMAASVFELIENYAVDGLRKMLSEMAEIEMSASLVGEMLKESNRSMAQCKVKTMDMMVKNLKMSPDQAELEIVSCLTYGIKSFSSQLSRKVLKDEIANNDIFKKYNVALGDNKTERLMNDFDQCFSNELKGMKDVAGLLSITESSVRTCTRQAMKEVVVFVLDTILFQELRSAGLTEEQTKGVIDTYKKRDSNLYKSIQNANSTAEIEKLTENGDYVVIQGIAYNVIYLLIRKDTKDYLSKEKTKEFAKNATDKVVACAATNTLGDCQKKMTPEIMKEIIIYLLPIEVAKEFNIATKSLLTQKQLSGLAVESLVRWWVTPGKTKTGKALVDYMVKEIIAGKSIARVQASNPVRTRVNTILTTSKNFFPKLINEIIQPELTKYKNRRGNPIEKFFMKLFIDERVYVWGNIKDTPSGQKAVAYIKAVLENIIVHGKSFTNADKQNVIHLVTEAGKEQNTIYSRNRRKP